MANNKRRRKLRALTEAAWSSPYNWEQARRMYASLPSLLDNFCHATVVRVTYGPRRELTLALQPLVWIGNQGHYGPSVDVHFSGIVDYEEIVALVSEGYKKSPELAWLRYDDNHQSNPDDLYVNLAFERIEAHVVIHCNKLSMADVEHDENA